MTHELVKKIQNIVNREISARGRTLSLPPLSEAEVQHLFALVRKLIERTPKAERTSYALLKFYCDWTLHAEIDKSTEGAKILAGIHDVLGLHLKKADNKELLDDLANILSLEVVRQELNALLARHNAPLDSFSGTLWNHEVVPGLVEIISHVQLKIGKFRWLRSILDGIKLRPLKGRSIVEALTMTGIPSRAFKPDAPESEVTYCLVITLSDTTRIVAPLVLGSLSPS